jgi:anaerobic ribonucleoside-triphosphate reductase
MEKYVIKRNGEYKPLDLFKIKDAIIKGFKSVNKPFELIIYEEVVLCLREKDTWSVEEIQDIIENILFEKKYFDVMKSFMLYRHTRKLQRDTTANIDSNTTYVNSTQTIEEYIGQTDWRINANANTAYSNAGLVNNVAGKIIANYWLDKVYTPEEGATHRNGDIHIHDLMDLMAYEGESKVKRPLILEKLLGKWQTF